MATILLPGVAGCEVTDYSAGPELCLVTAKQNMYEPADSAAMIIIIDSHCIAMAGHPPSSHVHPGVHGFQTATWTAGEHASGVAGVRVLMPQESAHLHASRPVSTRLPSVQWLWFRIAQVR